MYTTTRKPRRSFAREARAALLLIALCVAITGCGVNTHAGDLLSQALTQSSAVCCGTVREALDGALEARNNVFVPFVTETTELLAKEDAAGTTACRKAYDPRQTPYGPEGTAGRLVIPSAGISVALNLPGADAQAVTDAEDSACWMESRGDLNGVIGDHVNQDFAALFSVRPGDVCTIFRNGREHRYVCVSTGYGSNIETDVLDEEGHSLFECGDDRLCMYTCANGWRYVFVAKWQLDGTRPLHQYGSPSGTQVFFMEEDDG